ncbi:tuftelin 1b [Denticeps clupeoides]|uniref:Tuftelin-like n=1 Tax=Denticeps clupeoides TaxID=299321 RepID=A0AAY4DA17_9TELE|nr:tuftelin-like [Denticeps clupeoides]
MWTDEPLQVQEVRYCLRTLQEQMAARHNNNNNNNKEDKVENGEKRAGLTGVGETSHLQEMESRHQEDKHLLEDQREDLLLCLDRQAERSRKAEREAEAQACKVQELRKLMGCMEEENRALRNGMADNEDELRQLRALKEEKQEQAQRSEELEQEVGVLREKFHHLNDMLNSQHRKVRHMIEQLQNSRTEIQARDRLIQDMEEKVAFLEAENREMRDQMQHFLGGQTPTSQQGLEHNDKVVYSKPLTPTNGNKNLPFIKIIETKT